MTYFNNQLKIFHTTVDFLRYGVNKPAGRKLENEILCKTEDTCSRGICFATRRTVSTCAPTVRPAELCSDPGPRFLTRADFSHGLDVQSDTEGHPQQKPPATFLTHD